MNNFSRQYTPDNSYLSISTILNSLDAAVYVADMQTHEMIFMNRFAIENWGEPNGAPCYSIMQKGQKKPCSFCTNHLLVDKYGEPRSVHVWEFQNTVNNNWYECRDQAIRWIDGRLVRMEIAVDITQRKDMEQALKIAKEDAEKLACTDELTQIRNRRAIFEDADRMINESDIDISLIMMDIDYFKQINDTYGHCMGDRVLREVALLVEKNIRKEDVFGRVGGEEFALVVPNVDLYEVHRIAEDLRQKIYENKIVIGELTIEITCSFGVVSLDNSTFDKMYECADNALYSAKSNGRNRVEIYSN